MSTMVTDPKEYQDLLDRKQAILKEQDAYLTDRQDCKKCFAEMEHGYGDRVLEEMCQGVYEQGIEGDKMLLNLVEEARALMCQQDVQIGQLEEELDRYYQRRDRGCEEEISEINSKIRMMEG